MKLIFAVFLSASLLVGCVGARKKIQPQKAQPNAMQELARIKADTSNKEKAISDLNALVKQHPQTDIADDASILAGDLSYELKLYGNAFSFYMNVVDSNFYSPLEATALVKATSSLLKLGRFDEALALTNRGLDYRNLPDQEKIQLYNLRFSILTQLGDRLEAFETLVYLSQLDKDPQKQNSYQIKIQDYIDSTLTDSELEQAVRKSRLGEIRGYAYYRLANQYFEQREFDKAKGYYDNVISLLPNTELADTSADYIRQINARRRVSPKTIGAILPLTGRHSAIAQKTLRGLQLGLGIFGNNTSNFKLAVIDSEGNPDAARRAVERLVTEDNVIAIVGTLLSRTSTAVAAKSDELGVPNIALSQKAGITDIGPYVYRNALTSEMQVAELVQTAMEDHGFKKFAILYPNDPYGVEYTNLFWDHVLARGGQIVGVQPYDGKQTDFSGAIQRLVGTYYLEDRKSEYELLVEDWLSKQKRLSTRVSPPDDLLPPIIDFDAIFIPDSTRSLAQIAPMLAYHEVNEITLLGTNLWNSSSLLKRGRKHVEGALFVDSLLSSDQSFKTSSFYRTYRRTFAERPGIFETQAYDAGLLLRQLISSGANTRIELKEELDKIENFPGSIGNLNLNPYRELSRPVLKLGVREGRIVKNPAPITKSQN